MRSDAPEAASVKSEDVGQASMNTASSSSFVSVGAIQQHFFVGPPPWGA